MTTRCWPGLSRCVSCHQKPLYRRITEETLDYVIREMRDPNGGFYCAQDADSEGVEGKFYVWKLDEFRSVVGQDADLLAHYFDVTEDGNFEHHSILNISRPPEVFSKVEKIPIEELLAKAEAAKSKLYAARDKRIKPGRDEKVLTDWNGLMLRAMSDAAFYLKRDDYKQIAVQNAEFLLRTMWDGNRLLHNFKDGRARFNGYLDDYANLADGLLSLYELTFDYRWIEQTVAIVDRMIDQFWDTKDEGLFFTGKDHEALISRTKDFFDNAMPSGNSVAGDVLIRLAALLDRDDYRDKAEKLFKSCMNLMKQYPSGFGRMLAGVDFYVGPSREVALVQESEELLDVLRREYLPRTVFAGGRSPHLPLLQNRPAVDGKATVYVCENYTCRQPVTDAAAFEKQLSA